MSEKEVCDVCANISLKRMYLIFTENTRDGVRY